MRIRFALIAALAAPLLVPVAARAATTTTAPTFTKTVLPGAGGEPNVSISPSGRNVLADGLGPQSPATLYRSTDYGKTFQHITVDVPQTGGEDFDMRWLDDHTVIAADLSLGQGIFVDRSTDAGRTWTQTEVAEDQYDRPWIEHFGTKKVFVVAKGFDGIPYLYTSTDGGQSFGNPAIPLFVYGTPTTVGGPSPVESFATNQNAYVDHLVVDPRTGDLYVLFGIDQVSTYNQTQPVGAANQLYLAHLEGDHFAVHPVHLGGADESFLAGFNWMAVDRAGTVYALANGRIGGRWTAWLSYSKDKGKTWSKLVDVGTPGAANVYGAIAAANAGNLSLVYLRGSNNNPATEQPWYATTATITRANTAKPAIVRSRPIAAAIHTKDICFDGLFCGLPGFGNDRSLLDYIWTSIDQQGHPYSVVASDGPATASSNGVSVVIIRQNSVAVPLGAGMPS